MAFALHADALAPVVLNAAHQFAEGEQRNAVLPHGKATSKPTRRSNTATPPSQRR